MFCRASPHLPPPLVWCFQVEHLLTENERIAVKEGAQGGLTEGQQAQMARNDKAIATIRLQVRLTLVTNQLTRL